jgi:hypothetical protein
MKKSSKSSPSRHKKSVKFPYVECLVIWLVLVIAGIGKLWLAAGQHLDIISPILSPYDQGMFVTLGHSILRGAWLGPYNDLTLAKGPFYPIFIALTSYLHMPLLFAQQLLYLAGCLVLVISVQPLLRNYIPNNSKHWLVSHAQSIITVFLGLALIYNPMTTDINSSAQTMREGIYPALTLLSVAFFIGMLSYAKTKIWKYVLIAIGAGIAVSGFWLTREEGLWLDPFIILLTIYLGIFIIRRRQNLTHWKWRLVIAVLPILILWGSIFTISKVNEHYYGVDATVEFKTPQFLSAYSSLTRINDGVWMPQVPVSIEQRQLAYKVSPAFDTLKPYLEGGLGQAWAEAAHMGPPYQGQVNAGGFMWDFRASVREAGYYVNGKTAMNFYATMGRQVNAACADGKLKCFRSTDSMYPPLNKGYYGEFVSSFNRSFYFLKGFDQYDPTPVDNIGDPTSVSEVAALTHQADTNNYGHRRVRALQDIGNVYQYVSPVIAYVAIIAFVLTLVIYRPFKNQLFIVAALIGLTIIARMLLLSFINVTSFQAISTLYFSCAYPLLIVFDVICIVLLCGGLYDIVSKLRSSKKTKSS